MNKRGGFTDLFLFMIFAFVLILVSAIMIYVSMTTNAKLHEKLDPMTFGNANTTQIINNSMGAVDTAYKALYWISLLIIIGMVLGIFVGSFMVTTHPIFFLAHIFITFIAIFVAVYISNVYEQVMNQPQLSAIFANFVGANYIMGFLPMWVAVIGIGGGIIMFMRLPRGGSEYVQY